MRVRDEIKRIKRKYGLTPEGYVALLHAQNGKCAICGKGPNSGDKLWIDHNHVTQTVRGLLCKRCNFALGGFRDSIDVLLSAIEYLRRSEK
jgi:hypothetical protein